MSSLQISLLNILQLIVIQSLWNYLNKACPFLLFTSLNESKPNRSSQTCHLVSIYLGFRLHRGSPCGYRVDHLRVILYLFFLVSGGAEMHSRFDQRYLASFSVQRLLIHILQFQEQHWPSNQYKMLRFKVFSIFTYSSLKGTFMFRSCHHRWFYFL